MTVTSAPRALPTDARVEVPSCPVCGDTTRQRDALVLRDVLHDVPGAFHYDRCGSCRSVYQSPRVADDHLAACYPAEYFTHSRGVAPPQGRSLAHRVRALVVRGARCRRRSAWGHVARAPFAAVRLVPALRRRVQFGLLAALDPARTCGSSLEIGPGTGADMWRLASLGWSAEGLDIDPTAAARAAEHSGCPVHVGPLETFRPAHRFDLVYASHALEHLPRLADALRRCAALLDHGGRIVIVVPNPSSMVSRTYGGCAPSWDPPRHLVLTTPRALRAALAAAGFDQVEVSTTARRASHYAAIADARRHGALGADAWSVVPGLRSRLLAIVEWFLVRTGHDVGEEIIATARIA